MDKVIKEFNNGDLTYQLGYELYNNKVHPRIEIYKNKELLSVGFWSFKIYDGFFVFNAGSSYSYCHFGIMKEMFIELRKYNEIPEEVEEEYEKSFLLYKLNDFNDFNEL